MKKVTLTEESYNRLINEISYGTVDRAYDRSDDIFSEVSYTFDNFYDALGEAMMNVRYDSSDSEQKGNPYLEKIKAYADAIRVILDTKEDQKDAFYGETSKVDHNKFYSDTERPEDMENIDDVDLRRLQSRYPRK